MFIQRVCQALEKEKVSYALVGGHAVSLHGAVRGTVDIDLIIKWSLRNLQSTEKALKSIGLDSKLPITPENLFDYKNEYIENKNLVAWNFTNLKNPAEQVDIIITFELGSKKTIPIKTSKGTIKVLNLTDLIKMKRESGRPQDLEDINALERLK